MIYFDNKTGINFGRSKSASVETDRFDSERSLGTLNRCNIGSNFLDPAGLVVPLWEPVFSANVGSCRLIAELDLGRFVPLGSDSSDNSSGSRHGFGFRIFGGDKFGGISPYNCLASEGDLDARGLLDEPDTSQLSLREGLCDRRPLSGGKIISSGSRVESDKRALICVGSSSSDSKESSTLTVGGLGRVESLLDITKKKAATVGYQAEYLNSFYNILDYYYY